MHEEPPSSVGGHGSPRLSPTLRPWPANLTGAEPAIRRDLRGARPLARSARPLDLTDLGLAPDAEHDYERDGGQEDHDDGGEVAPPAHRA